VIGSASGGARELQGLFSGVLLHVVIVPTEWADLGKHRRRLRQVTPPSLLPPPASRPRPPAPSPRAAVGPWPGLSLWLAPLRVHCLSLPTDTEGARWTGGSSLPPARTTRAVKKGRRLQLSMRQSDRLKRDLEAVEDFNRRSGSSLKSPTDNSMS
jgi:hypothetical protein